MAHSPARILRAGLMTGLLASACIPVHSAEDLSSSTGPQLYKRYCASCHGTNGKGDGPVAPFFKLLPPDLTEMSRRSGGTFPAERARRIIDGRERTLPHGARQMPVWGTEFEQAADQSATAKTSSADLIAKLVEYLRSIQR